MYKLIAGLMAVSLAAVFTIGLMAARTVAETSSPVQAAIAEQESAKAEALRAQAEAERAKAAMAWTETEADKLALSEKAAAARWWALSPAIAFSVLAIGGAFALVTWLQTRARIVYPNADGLYPILIDRKMGGALVIADTGRQLSSIVAVDAKGQITAPLWPDMQTAARLASQAQAAGAMVGLANAQGPGELPEAPSAAGALPMPQFAQLAPGGAEVVDTGPNFVYVKAPGTTKAQRDLQDVGEFIRTGWGPRGLSRAAWLGKRMAGTGNKVSRGYYDELTKKLATAGVIVDEGNGWRPAVELAEALDAFGLAHDDGAG
jgi:hypothetical protein